MKALLSFTFVLLLLPCMAASYQMKFIDVGRRVLQVRLARPAFGPESLAFDHHGSGPYTGVSNGRVLKWRGRRRGWAQFAYNSKHNSIEQCAAKKKKAVVVPESVCGRPLGLQFHKKSGDLYIADAYLGLMRVGVGGGLARVVAAEAGGVPFNFVNGVDVDQETGEVYFTDSSTTFQRSDYLLILLSRDRTGRLLKFDPRTDRVTVLQTGLAFPNGVAISRDRTHLVVAHTTSCQLLRYYIRGPRAGKSELFTELPGYPDNVRSDLRGGYWVALNRDKTQVNGTRHLAAVRVSGDGRVVEALGGFGSVTISEVVERNGTLWLGSVDMAYVGLFRVVHVGWQGRTLVEVNGSRPPLISLHDVSRLVAQIKAELFYIFNLFLKNYFFRVL